MSEPLADMRPVSRLHAKLAEVMAEVGRVPKRGRNEFHKYDYATEADIVDAVRGALSSRGISLVPSVVQVNREGTLTTVLMSFQFNDGETGGSASYQWAGTGDDKGDKGLYKAMTGALKYFLLKTFLMPTGDDSEADTETDKRASGAPSAQRRKPTIPSGPLRAPIITTCLRCSAEPEDGSDYCVKCNKLHADRLADDALAAAGLKPVSYDVRGGGENDAASGHGLGVTPDHAPASITQAATPPPTDIKTERNRLFALLNEYGWTTGDQGRPERLRLYSRVLGRMVTEAAAKKLTAGEWRRIADTVKADNEPPPDDAPPPGLAL